MKEQISQSEAETLAIAANFAANLETPFPSGATVVGLYGELGAGKTTFMKGVAKYFNIVETIQSPTFVIEKIYELENQKFKHLIHIDAYRIEKSDEMLNLGWREIISDPHNLILIEWPERIKDILPEHLVLRFEHVEGKGENPKENQRKISIA